LNSKLRGSARPNFAAGGQSMIAPLFLLPRDLRATTRSRKLTRPTERPPAEA
jgi:hypothetical protein